MGKIQSRAALCPDLYVQTVPPIASFNRIMNPGNYNEPKFKIMFASEFDRVRPHGDKAVAVIKNYEEVAKTLDKSVEMALEANRTISLVMDSLSRVSIQALEEQSQNSLTQSQILEAEIARAQANSGGKMP